METIKIKHKQFEVLEIVSIDTFKCNFKNQTYLVKKYEPGSVELDMFKKLLKTNVSLPKVKYIDKKSGYVASELLDGVLLSDYILNNDFNEDIYKQIFRNSYMARTAGYNLDYSLDKWMLVDNRLVYVDSFCAKYDPRVDFTKEKMREWFMTRELAKFYENKGILFDKNRIKNEFAVNKEMVLMTCKYYL